jgi:hypothetical protein
VSHLPKALEGERKICKQLSQEGEKKICKQLSQEGERKICKPSQKIAHVQPEIKIAVLTFGCLTYVKITLILSLIRATRRLSGSLYLLLFKKVRANRLLNLEITYFT